MSSQITSINATSSSSTTTNSSSSAQKLTNETKQQLEALGVDTTNITTEAQGQIALLQAQQEHTQAAHLNGHAGSGKEEIQELKSKATELAAKVGVSVSSDEKLSDIMSAVGPAIDAKVSAAGNDQAKIEEAQELQDEYSALSSSLSNIQAQHAQNTQGQQALSSSLDTLAAQNKLYHQV